jgi:tetratricopeptide (TPR) repeat protein
LAAKGGSGLAMANLGDVYAYGRQGLAKDVSKARDYYRAAIDSGEPDVVARAQNSLAWHFVLTNSDLDQAEQLATAALAHDPQDAAVLDTLGWIKHVRGDHKAALAHLLKAAALKPATTQLAHLGAVQAASGDAAAARKSYEAALAALPPDYEEPTVDVKAIKSWLAAN